MQYISDNPFTSMFIVIGGMGALRWLTDLSRALPLIYYCWRVTKKCEGAYISQIGDTGCPHNIYNEGLLLSCGNTPAEAWKNAWAYLNAKKTPTP